jgi:hypothetical protein
MSQNNFVKVIFKIFFIVALEDDSQLCGGEVYGFKTPKKSGQMAQLASESRTPKSILKTPVTKEGTPKKCKIVNIRVC